MGADYLSIETALPTQFIWRPSVPFSSSGTHRINTRSMSLYLMSVISIARQLQILWLSICGALIVLFNKQSIGNIPILHSSLLMEYTDIRYSDITTCIDSVVQAVRLGTYVSNGIVWGRAVSCLHNQAPLKHNWLLVMDNTHIQVTVTWYVYWFCWVQSSTTGRSGMVPNELVWGEQSHAYIINTNETQLTPCVWNQWHQVQWNYYSVLILWVPEAENWYVWSPMNCMRESSLMLT